MSLAALFNSWDSSTSGGGSISGAVASVTSAAASGIIVSPTNGQGNVTLALAPTSVIRSIQVDGPSVVSGDLIMAVTNTPLATAGLSISGTSPSTITLNYSAGGASGSGVASLVVAGATNPLTGSIPINSADGLLITAVPATGGGGAAVDLSIDPTRVVSQMVVSGEGILPFSSAVTFDGGILNVKASVAGGISFAADPIEAGGGGTLTMNLSSAYTVGTTLFPATVASMTVAEPTLFRVGFTTASQNIGFIYGWNPLPGVAPPAATLAVDPATYDTGTLTIWISAPLTVPCNFWYTWLFAQQIKALPP